MRKMRHKKVNSRYEVPELKRSGDKIQNLRSHAGAPAFSSYMIGLPIHSAGLYGRCGTRECVDSGMCHTGIWTQALLFV